MAVLAKRQRFYNFVSTINHSRLVKMSKQEQDRAYFIAFCIEQYKNRKGLSGAEVVSLFDQYGVMEYLYENFEMLHTQSYQWILDDIEFIANRK